MAVTIRDIAKHLNLSHSTVSRIINNRDSEFISSATRTRVQQTAQELGYHPNYHARSLQTGRTHAIGLVLDRPNPQSENRFWQFMLNGISVGARAHDYDLLCIGPARGQSELERGLEYVKERRVDALVVPGYFGFVTHSAILNQADAPIVLAGGGPADSRHPIVEHDPAPGIEAAVDHLAELGHRRILWFDVERTDSGAAQERRAAFCKAIERRALKGIDARMGCDEQPSQERSVELARRAFPEALKQLPGATSVICFNEPTAFGVYAAAADCGLRIPQDLSVIGFDDIHALVASPAMTVVSHMLYKVGAKAAELAIKLAESRTATTRFHGRRERIPTELIIRKSTVAPQGVAGPVN
jgi:DNA-binding LacI/PurR family transcriptional regulator